MRLWARARTAWPKAVGLGLVCAGSRPDRPGRSAVRRRRTGVRGVSRTGGVFLPVSR